MRVFAAHAAERVHLSADGRLLLTRRGRAFRCAGGKAACRSETLGVYRAAASNAANIGLRAGANGLVTVTPRHVNPSCRSGMIHAHSRDLRRLRHGNVFPYSARSIVTGSILTARITAGSAASNATAKSASEGKTSIGRSVAFT